VFRINTFKQVDVKSQEVKKPKGAAHHKKTTFGINEEQQKAGSNGAKDRINDAKYSFLPHFSYSKQV